MADHASRDAKRSPVAFDNGSSLYSPTSSRGLSGEHSHGYITSPPSAGLHGHAGMVPKRPDEMLKNLYKRPDASDAYRLAQGKLAGKHERAADKQDPVGLGSLGPRMPLPEPPLQQAAQAASFRTTMLRKDYERIRLRRPGSGKQNKESQASPSGASTTPVESILTPSPLLLADGALISAAISFPASSTGHGVERPASQLSSSDSVDEVTRFTMPGANIVDLIISLRKKRGWRYDFPQDSGGNKENLMKMKTLAFDSAMSTCPMEDDGRFYYCLPVGYNDPRSPYDPYNLIIVPAEKAKSQPTYYWTVSATLVAQMWAADPLSAASVSTPSLQWIWEKELHRLVRSIRVFALFRQWKAFTTWKMTVRNSRSTSSKDVLLRQLFSANEILQGCLLYVQRLCEAASSSLTGLGRGDDAISLVDLSQTEAQTLEAFVSAQRRQAEHATKQLAALHTHVAVMIWESCAAVAEMEGVTSGIRPTSSPKKPTYAQIAEWRKVLARLSQFLKLVDYQTLELLRRLVKTSLRRLVDFVEASINAEDLAEEAALAEEQADGSTEHGDDNSSRDGGSSAARHRPSAGGRRSGASSHASAGAEAQEATVPVGKPSEGRRGQRDAYLIPKFDFDKPPSEHGIPGADEVLQEVREQEKIEELAVPVVRMQLVLQVPASSSRGARSGGDRSAAVAPTSRSSKARRATAAAPQSSLRRVLSQPDAKKSVTFPAQPAAPEAGTEGAGQRGALDASEASSTSNDEDEDGEDRARQPADAARRPPAAMTPSDYAYESSQSGMSKVRQKTTALLAPTAEQFRKDMKLIVARFDSVVGTFVSMLEEPRLAVFYSPPKHDLKLNGDYDDAYEREDDERPRWPDTASLFAGDPEYEQMSSDLDELLARAIFDVIEFAEGYEKYCVMVDDCRELDIVSLMDQKQWGTEDFQQVLATHTEQLNQMRKMTLRKRVGMIQLSAEDFSASCLPYPSHVIKMVNERLPVVAFKKNEDLLSLIKGASKRLDKTPESVDEFVEHLSFLARMTSDMPAMDREFAVVTKLYTIAKDFDVKIVPEEFALYQTLSPSFQHLKTTILFCEAKKEENIRQFSADLSALVRDTRFSLMALRSYARDPALLSTETLPVVALERIKLLQDDVQTLSVKVRNYANYQERFGTSLASSRRGMDEYALYDRGEDTVKAQVVQSELGDIERDLTLRRLLWESQEELTRLVAEWTATPFDELNVELLQKTVGRFTQTVYMLEKGLPSNEMVPLLKQRVADFKQGMPVITSLRNPSLRLRHWADIESLIGRPIPRGQSFQLGNLLEMNIFKYKDKIQDISTTATNEATLESMLQKVVLLWQNTDLHFVAHQGRDTHIISGADELLALLEESQVTVGTIRGSRYVNPIKAQVEDWDRRLALLARTLDEWMTCQRNWLYLEQIFGNQDIQRQLPNEAKLFATLDKSWKDIMRRTVDRPNALKAATASGVLEALQAANVGLEKIHKCLEDYLETKRLVFPRFYFLSNDELLDILAQSKNPDAVQPHLAKCFGNVKSLEIRAPPRQPPTVMTMRSAEGEVVPMPRNVRARGPVEQWLGSVETGMFDTVKRHLKNGLAEWIGSDLCEWVLKHPGQVVLTVVQIIFSKDVAKALSDYDALGALTKCHEGTVAMLGRLARLVSTELGAAHRRLSVEALLTVQVHNRDIVAELRDKRVTSRNDFEWLRQLRYEWDDAGNNCVISQSNAGFVYGYEYLGCSPRLVMTPLTDRCYLTLTGALRLNLGGSPAGPAGTGKTETVKDLARSMGKQCVVFNCSEGLDYKMLGKFFSGLSQSGSWCCFDEFNRIDIEVLSVVAQQIHTVKTAKDNSVTRFMFEGREIRLNATCGFFITMNPSYAGRVELPDNLKSLFRPVAMMVPDYALIAEIMLFSEGFGSAKTLSRKIVNLYQLASTQLSQQDHYDFGMRAIKSILVMAGHRKRQSQASAQRPAEEQRRPGDAAADEDEEAHILMHSLRDANLPKFIAEDVPLFESLLEDLFPGMKPPRPHQLALEKAIAVATHDLGLQPWPSQAEKVKQFHSQLLVRHGVMLVGPTCGGKTSVRSILQRALVLLPAVTEIVSGGAAPATADEAAALAAAATSGGAALDAKAILRAIRSRRKGHVEISTVNPKCVRLEELYGVSDPNTFEWSDGLIACMIRRFARDLSADQRRGVGGGPGEDGGGEAETGAGAETPAGGEADRRRGSAAGASSRADARHLGARSSSQSQQRGDGAAAEEAADGEESEESASEHEGTLSNWRWLVLDGPVDTAWVENLNTVLDDTKVLCLANGERIGLPPGLRLVFEVDDLSQASPATISRCAMVYMDPVDLGWRPSVKTWLNRLPKDLPDVGREHLWGLFEHSVDRGLAFWRQHYKQQHVPATETSLVASLCAILTSFLEFMAAPGGGGFGDRESQSPEAESGARPGSAGSGTSSSAGGRRKHKKKKDPAKADEEEEQEFFVQKHPGQLRTMLGKLFVFAYTWSIGGNFERDENLEDDGGIMQRGEQRHDAASSVTYEFDGLAHEVFDIEPPLGVRLPTGNKTIYSYFVDLKSGNFVLWDVLVSSTQSLIEKTTLTALGENFQAQEQQRVGGDMVPTVDTVRYAFIMALLVVNKYAVLLTGESGVGKSALILHMMKQLSKDGGTSSRGNTLLGNIFHYADRNNELMENIMTLTKGAPDDTDRALGGVYGAQRSKPQPGILTSLVQFSSQTSVPSTCLQITRRLVKKGKDHLVGPRNRRVLVFIDDLNMPAAETYGAQPPLEFLRQFLDLAGYFDTKRLAWKAVSDVTFITACAPPGGGRHALNPRLLKHFCMLALPTPATRSLQHIYQVQLGKFLHEGDFMPEVKDSLFSFVSGGISIYYRMCGSMLPTPAKTHYTFNIRDLSQVVQGLMQAHEEAIVNRDNCALLLAHESTRVFHDRLTNDKDRSDFFSYLSEMLHDYFKVNWTGEDLMRKPAVFGDFFSVDSGADRTGAPRRIYRPISDESKLVHILEEYYMRQQLGTAQVHKMVFFREAAQHVARAVRVFRQPARHLLLVGVDGTGKATCVALACYIAGCELYRLTMTRGYGLAEFREDLKKIFRIAGIKGKSVVFLLVDSDIVKETFLEDINCILNSGEVPGLFDNEETDAIVMELKQEASQKGVPDNRHSVYEYFVQRVRRNLHIVLTMSPAGSRFRQRCRANPSLVNCCTIDWYDEWSDEAMLAVAAAYLPASSFDISSKTDAEDLKETVSRMCVSIHERVVDEARRFWAEARRHHYLTPSGYLEFIKIYASMLQRNRDEFLSGRQRLLVGLAKLSEANSLVGVMQDELVGLGPKIEDKAKDTELLLQQLEKDQEAVDQVRAIVAREEALMQQETKIVEDYANECERDLAEVTPALQNATSALNALVKADIAEIRVYTNPPELVKTVMGAVQTLLRYEKPSWESAKQLLGEINFLSMLVNIDKDNIPEKVFKKLKKYTSRPEFSPEKVGAVSVACKSMCLWVQALEHFHDVFKMVKPKQRKVDEAKEALSMAQENLQKKRASLAKIVDHLRMLQQQYQDSVNQRESLKERKRTTAVRLERAAVLTNALADEKVRWEESVDELDRKIDGIVGDTLVSSAAVAYFGAFTVKYRQTLVDDWKRMCAQASLPLSGAYDFVRDRASANDVLRWHTEGLPQDRNSVENAIIVKNSFKWPLMIDPQGQAYHWIKETEGQRLIVADIDDVNYMRSVERAIRMGDPILLLKVTEELDPSLKPVLQRDTFTRSGTEIIKLGDNEIEYNRNFRLYMVTSASNPHFLPSVGILVTVINFTVTFEGLGEQLLSTVVRQERPALELQRSELLSSISGDVSALKELEDRSLSLLQKSEGHILDDEDLVQTLQKSKLMSAEIGKRIRESEETEKYMSKTRKKYMPVATRGAVLYFALADLANINHMYQFSLPWFKTIFAYCIDLKTAKGSKSLAGASGGYAPLAGVLRPSSRNSPDLIGGQRSQMGLQGGAGGHRESADTSTKEMSPEHLKQYMKEMIDRLTWQVYRVVAMGLFSQHQLVFSFLLCCNVMKTKRSCPDDVSDVDAIDELEWTAFMQAPILASMLDEQTLAAVDGLTPMQRLEKQSNILANVQRPPWIKDSAWRLCQHADLALPGFSGLCLSIMNNNAQWNAFKASDDAYHFLGRPFSNLRQSVADSEPRKATSPSGSVAVTFAWERLSAFQRIMLIKILRPEALVPSMYSFISEQLGDAYAKPTRYDLRDVLAESHAKTPLVFLLSPGSDPTSQLLKFARDTRGSTLHLDMVSLGRGQGPKAEELIAKAQILKGRWVFLQNCHLAASWMPKLQAIVAGFNKPQSDVDPQFRLWLSSKPDESFPLTILQIGTKLAVDAPQGVRAGLLRSLQGGSFEKFYTDSPANSPARTLLYGLCLFNTIIHERKKYGALGWNIPYEFNDSDFEVAMLQMNSLLRGSEDGGEKTVPWSALRYLAGDITYGGRVTDGWDRRLLQSLLARFYAPEALQPGYSYSGDHVYRPLPGDYTFGDVRRHVEESLPAVDSAELFGMTRDAETTYMESQARHVIDTIQCVQPNIVSQLTGAVAKSGDDVVVETAKDILRCLPMTVEDEDGDASQPASYSGKKKMTFAALCKSELSKGADVDVENAASKLMRSALVTCLRQEIDRFDGLLQVVRKTLGDLVQAVRGEIVMSEDLEDAYQAVLKQRVPSRWKQAAYESLKPLGLWVRDLQQRIDFFGKWADQVAAYVDAQLRSGPGAVSPTAAATAAGSPLSFADELAPARELPRSFWLPGFFFPQGFLTALLQAHARKTKSSIDALEFRFSVVPNPGVDTEEHLDTLKQDLDVRRIGFNGAGADGGALVFGLYIDGARWDLQRRSLQDGLPGRRFSRLPELLLQPVKVSQTAAAARSCSRDAAAASPFALGFSELRRGLVSRQRRVGPGRRTPARSPRVRSNWGRRSMGTPFSGGCVLTSSAALAAAQFARLKSTRESVRADELDSAAQFALPRPRASLRARTKQPSSESRWSSDQRTRSIARTESLASISQAADISRSPSVDGKERPRDPEASYNCPLYRTSARAGTLSSTGHSTNYVTTIQLPSEHPADFWISRGVALLCQLDDV